MTVPATATLPAPDTRSMRAGPPTAQRRGYWWLGGGAAAVVVAALVVAAVLNWPLGTRGNQSTDQPTGTSDPPTIATTVTTSASDLSVSVPISTPACDGRYIVVVGSAGDPDRYQPTVQGFLDQHPDAKYLHAPSTGCSSLRQRLDSGDDIYAVYYGPFKGKGPACRKRADVGADSFVRRLDNTSSPERAVSCG